MATDPDSDGRQQIVIIAGMPRTGTTFLYHNLQKHPSIFVPYRKELEYFNFYYDKGTDWFLEHFDGIRPDQIGLDIGPKYFLSDAAVERIAAYNPNCKVIVGVRDPIDFALSWYAQYSTFHFKMPPFEEFIEYYRVSRRGKSIEVRIKDNLIPRMINKLSETFGENLLLYDYKEIRRGPLDLLRAIEGFVGVPHYFDDNNFDNVVINAAVRRHNKLFAYIMSREAVIVVLRRLFPPMLLRYLRGKYDMASKRESGSARTTYLPEHIAIAERALAPQRERVQDLFATSGFVLGSGLPFVADQGR